MHEPVHLVDIHVDAVLTNIEIGKKPVYIRCTLTQEARHALNTNDDASALHANEALNPG